MSVKVSAGIGLSGMLVAMVALVMIGIGVVIAFGAIVVLSEATAAVFILVLFMVLTFFFGSEQRKTFIVTVCLFLILAILFGKSIQTIFEAISPFFLRAMEVIL